ncbi:MAG: pantoate--beta-alanine ligase [Marmoricola sp.]
MTTAVDTVALVSTRAELAEFLAARAGTVALVPTMGALHEGHASLVRHARELADTVVVSIFVNPLQFAAGEDLDRYPRTLEADLELCGAAGADVVFASSVDEVYPGGEPQVTVEPGPLGSVLEGEVRPTHFRGVLTVVAKLFGLVRPDVAVFGEKDYQQLVLIKRMVSDLCMPVRVVGAPIVREEGGLARSSRNRYLSDEQRNAALVLSAALRAAGANAQDGVEAARAAALTVLANEPDITVDYLEFRAEDLGDPQPHQTARALIAARVGSTRLIDNSPIVF